MPDVTIDVLDFTLARTGAGPIQSAFSVSWDDPLSMAAMFQFSIPAIDPKAAGIDTQKTLMRIYLDGSARFLGIVESKKRVIPADGAAYFVISGRSLLAELEDEDVAFLTLGGDFGAGLTTGPSTILSTNSGGTWTLDSTNGNTTTTNTYYGRFVGASRLAALYALTKRTGEHFIYRPWTAGSADRKVIWIGAAGTDSGIRAIQGGGDAVALEGNPNICLITNLEEIEDGADLTNRIRVYGAGDDLQNSALDLRGSSYSPTTVVGSTGQPNWFSIFCQSNNYIDWNYSLTTLGYRLRTKYIQFEDIAAVSNTDADLEAAGDMLANAGMEWLRRYGIPQRFYSLSVVQLPWAVEPGQTVRVIYYEEDADGTVVHDINEDLIILNIATTLEDGGGILHSLTVSTTDRMPTNSDEEIANRIEKASIYQTTTQLGPNVNTISYIDEFDHVKAAVLPFWLGTEIHQVQQVLLRFQVLPLRSTVESLAGSSTSSGPSSNTSSLGGSSHTHDVAMDSHQHKVYTAFTGSTNRVMTFDASGFLTYETSDVGNIGIPTTEVTGTTTETSVGESTHTHNIAHDHTFTPNITANYGIFEDSGATVPDTSSVANLLTDIAIELNGVALVAGDITLTSGYFTADLTQDIGASNYDLVDADTFRPVSVYNTIAIGGFSTFRGRIVAQLQIRSLVQAVAIT